jgi:hypothetical protein
MRALAKGLGDDFEIKREGREESWRLVFSVTPELRLSVEFLNNKSGAYVKALERLRDEVRNEPMTKDEMEHHLLTELQTLYNLAKGGASPR